METGRFLEANPVISSESLTGSQVNEVFAWLALRVIDSVTIDDERFVSVDHVEHLPDGTMRVVCGTEEGSSHLFDYNMTEDVPVRHSLIEKP